MQKAAAGQGVAPSGAIDLAHLERATFGDHALRREVLSLFQRQAATLGVELAQADSDRLRADIAHRLRGAALGVGAMTVAEAAAAFERAPENAAQLAEALGRLAASIAEARTATTEIIGGN
ncbi:MAG TPA: Hpt domain-containing protein [Xanthobacteraceae bacterium]|nr:Hpt domain-containing protein [Xanthobacteraceae bacterium]